MVRLYRNLLRKTMMILNPFVALSLVMAMSLALPAVAHSPDAAAPAPHDQAAPTAADTASNAPWQSLSARFRVSYLPVGQAKAPPPQTWLLTRSPEQIALTKGPIEDIWRRDGHGRIGLQRVFRDDRFLVDYFPGELQTLAVDVRWDTLATLFDERSIRMLLPRGMTRIAGRSVYRFTGQLGADKVELHWDAAARLPARLTRQGPKGGVRFELLEWHDVAPAAWPRAGDGVDSFQRLDAADFGDMENNPLVRKAEALDIRTGWRSAHAH